MKAKRILVTFIVALAIASAAVVIVVTLRLTPRQKPGDVNENAHHGRCSHREQLAGERAHQRFETLQPAQADQRSERRQFGPRLVSGLRRLDGSSLRAIVVDGVIYISAPLSKIYAVQASTGKVLWKYDPQIRLDQALNGSYSARTNGGVAVWNGKFMLARATAA